MNKKQCMKAIRETNTIHLMGAWTSIMIKISRTDAVKIVNDLFDYTSEEELDYSRFSVEEHDKSIVISI